MTLAYAIILTLMMASPAAAHAIIEFDHAQPAVGSTVDANDAHYLAIWFRAQFERDEIEIRLRNGQGVVPLVALHEDGPTWEIIARVPNMLPPGIYFVDWREIDEGELWHTYHFIVTK